MHSAVVAGTHGWNAFELTSGMRSEGGPGREEPAPCSCSCGDVSRWVMTIWTGLPG